MWVIILDTVFEVYMIGGVSAFDRSSAIEQSALFITPTILGAYFVQPQTHTFSLGSCCAESNTEITVADLGCAIYGG